MNISYQITFQDHTLSPHLWILPGRYVDIVDDRNLKAQTCSGLWWHDVHTMCHYDPSISFKVIGGVQAHGRTDSPDDTRKLAGQ
jgi:hypothetical protein